MTNTIKRYMLTVQAIFLISWRIALYSPIDLQKNINNSKRWLQLAKWLSCVLSTYLYRAFDCMFLSCHVRVWIHSETHTWHDRNIELIIPRIFPKLIYTKIDGKTKFQSLDILNKVESFHSYFLLLGHGFPTITSFLFSFEFF